jgi:hypothetical protein
MPVPVIATGDVPPASQFNDWMININWVRKTVSEDRLSTVTLANDTQLLKTLSIGVYRMEVFLNYDAPTAAGIQIAWTLPVSATMNYTAVGPTTTAVGYNDDQTAFFDQTSTTNFGAHGAGTRSAILFVGTINIVTAGTVQLRWAQRVSNATRTRMFAESTMDFQRRE